MAQYLTKDDLSKLMEAFKPLPPDVVMDVAHSCNFNVAETVAILREMKSKNKDSFQTVSYGGTRKKSGGISVPAQRVERSNYIQIIELINEGWKVLVLMRGLPGSGKTTLAREILQNSVPNAPPRKFIFSADDFFWRTGRYEYDVKKLEQAHIYSQQNCYEAMKKGVSPLIVDNTNIKQWEMQVYCTMAVQFGYAIEICEPENSWARDPEVLSRKNTHKVPKAKIITMLNNFEGQITTRSMLRDFKLYYQCPMPQKRMYPPLEISRPPISGPPTSRPPMSGPPVSGPPTSRISPPVEQIAEEDQMKLAMLLSLQESKMSYINKNFPEEGFSSGKKLQPIMEYIHKPTKVDSSEVPDSTTKAKVDSTQKEYVYKFQNKQEPLPEVVNEPKVEPKPETEGTSDISLIDWGEDTAEGASSVSSHFPLMPVQIQNVSAKSDSDIQNKKMKSNNYDSMGNNNSIPDVFQSTTKANETKPDNNFLLPDIKSLHTSTYQNLSNNDTNNSDASWEQSLQAWNTQTAPTPNEDGLSSWGTSITELQSWNTTIPLKSTSEPAITITRKPETSTKTVQMSDKQTNTSVEDFNFALNCSEKSTGRVILVGRQKPINAPNVKVNIPLRSKITVDVGSMTEEDLFVAVAHNSDHVAKLREFFPNIPIEYMLEVYEKCQEDINWTMELLSETDYIPTSIPKPKETKQSEPMELDSEQDNLSTSTPVHINSWEIFDPHQEMLEKAKREDEVIKLKKQLEENVTFKREHYSNHTWEIKNIKQGVYTPQNSQCEEQKADNEVTRSDSVSDSDENVDESFNEETNKLHQVDLGPLLVSQLEKIVGNEETVNQRFSTVVQMPESMARQLHALYLQSLCVQIENQSIALSGDEELAKQIQEEEHNSKEPDLKRIMDEQLAEFLQQKDMQQYKNISPDDLATRLTKIKLYQAFPTLQKNMVDDVLAACNYKYEDAVYVLINSVEKNTIQERGNLLEPPISDVMLQEMKTEKAMIEKTQDDADEASAARTAQSFRDEANDCLKRRKHLQELVNMYHQKGMGEVAVFYSELARKAQQQLDYANQKASYLYMYENSAKLNDGITIDLHYLFVREAVTSLDVFIDHKVQQLIETNKRHGDFFVITGRGNRSNNGKSKIKPAVIQRLRKRKVKFSEINPGLLKIKLQQNLPMATDI